MEDARKVTIELNVARPLGGFIKRFTRELRTYLHDKVVQKDESLYIPPDIVFEFRLSPWYSRDTPTIRIKQTEPTGLVKITQETTIEAIFKLTDTHPTEKEAL